MSDNIIILDDLLQTISELVKSVISVLQNVNFKLQNTDFNFWVLLVVFFILDALILIFMTRGKFDDK